MATVKCARGKRGRPSHEWNDGKKDRIYCPACGFVIATEGSWDKPTKKYCEECGAKMDGGTEK